MWVITVYSSENHITMLEFEIEKEAREAFERTQGCKILTEIVYLDERKPALAAV